MPRARRASQLTSRAKFAARLGFASPTAYEDWIARGSPEDKLPAEVRADREAALAEAAALVPSAPALPVPIEPVEQPPDDPIKPVVELGDQPPVRRPAWSRNPWDVFVPRDEPEEDPFALARRPTPRRSPSGYFSN